MTTLTARRRTAWGLSGVPESMWPFLTFALLWVIGGALRPSLFALDALWDTGAFGIILALVAAGQTVVVISGGLDLSVPNTLTISALSYVSTADSLGPFGALVPSLLIGTAIGVCNGAAIAFLEASPIVMTIAMNGFLLGLILLLFPVSQLTTTPQVLVDATAGKIGLLGTEIPAIVPCGLGLLLLFQLLLWATGAGRRTYLVGASPGVARYVGISVCGQRLGAYAASGLLAAVSGVVVAGFFQQTSPGMGTPYLLPSLAAVIVGGASISGGRGSIAGTLGGALILSQVATLLSIGNLGVVAQQILYGVVILAVASLYGWARTVSS